MTDADIATLEAELRAAQLGADVAALDRLISEDLLFTGPDGALATKADDLAAYREGVIRHGTRAPGTAYAARHVAGLLQVLVGNGTMRPFLLAGLFVVETFCREPDLFDTYLAFDPSLWWNNQRRVTEVGDQLRRGPATKKTLFLASSAEPELAALTQPVFGSALRSH